MHLLHTRTDWISCFILKGEIVFAIHDLITSSSTLVFFSNSLSSWRMDLPKIMTLKCNIPQIYSSAWLSPLTKGNLGSNRFQKWNNLRMPQFSGFLQWGLPIGSSLPITTLFIEELCNGKTVIFAGSKKWSAPLVVPEINGCPTCQQELDNLQMSSRSTCRQGAISIFILLVHIRSYRNEKLHNIDGPNVLQIRARSG